MLKAFLEDLVILHRFSCPLSEQNDIVECMDHIFVERGLAMLHQEFMPLIFWPYKISITVYLMNHMSSKVLNDLSLFEFVYHKCPTYKTLKTFGTQCFPV